MGIKYFDPDNIWVRPTEKSTDAKYGILPYPLATGNDFYFNRFIISPNITRATSPIYIQRAWLDTKVYSKIFGVFTKQLLSRTSREYHSERIAIENNGRRTRMSSINGLPNDEVYGTTTNSADFDEPQRPNDVNGGNRNTLPVDNFIRPISPIELMTTLVNEVNEVNKTKQSTFSSTLTGIHRYPHKSHDTFLYYDGHSDRKVPILVLNPIYFPNNVFYQGTYPTIGIDRYWGMVKSNASIESPSAGDGTDFVDYGTYFHADKLVSEYHIENRLQSAAPAYHPRNANNLSSAISTGNIPYVDRTFTDTNRLVNISTLNTERNIQTEAGTNYAKLDELTKILRGVTYAKQLVANSGGNLDQDIRMKYGYSYVSQFHMRDPREYAPYIIPINGKKISYNPYRKTISLEAGDGIVLRRTGFKDPTRPNHLFYALCNESILPTVEFREKLSIDQKHPDIAWDKFQLVCSTNPFTLLFGIEKEHIANKNWKSFWRYLPQPEALRLGDKEIPNVYFESTGLFDNLFKPMYMHLNGLKLEIDDFRLSKEINEGLSDVQTHLIYKKNGDIDIDGDMYSPDGTWRKQHAENYGSWHHLFTTSDYASKRVGAPVTDGSRHYVFNPPMTIPLNATDAVRYREHNGPPPGPHVNPSETMAQSEAFSNGGYTYAANVDLIIWTYLDTRFFDRALSGLMNVPFDGMDKPNHTRWRTRDDKWKHPSTIQSRYYYIGEGSKLIEPVTNANTDYLKIRLDKLPTANKVVVETPSDVRTYNYRNIRPGTILVFSNQNRGRVGLLGQNGATATTTNKNQIVNNYLSEGIVTQLNNQDSYAQQTHIAPVSLYFQTSVWLMSKYLQKVPHRTTQLQNSTNYPRPMHLSENGEITLTGNLLNGIPVHGFTTMTSYLPNLIGGVTNPKNPINGNPYREISVAADINYYTTSVIRPGYLGYQRTRYYDYSGILKDYRKALCPDVVKYGERYMAEFLEDGTSSIFTTGANNQPNIYRKVEYSTFTQARRWAITGLIPIDNTVIRYVSNGIYEWSEGTVLFFHGSAIAPNDLMCYLVTNRSAQPTPFNTRVDALVNNGFNNLDQLKAHITAGNSVIDYQKVNPNPQRKKWLVSLAMANYGLSSVIYQKEKFFGLPNEITIDKNLPIKRAMYLIDDTKLHATRPLMGYPYSFTDNAGWRSSWVGYMPKYMDGSDLQFRRIDALGDKLPLTEMFDVPDWCEGWWNKEGQDIEINTSNWTMRLPIATWFKFRIATNDHEHDNSNFVIVKLPAKTYQLGMSVERIIADNFKQIQHGAWVDRAVYTEALAGIRAKYEAMPSNDKGDKYIDFKPYSEEQKQTLMWFGENGYFPTLYLSAKSLKNPANDWTSDIFKLTIYSNGKFGLSVDKRNLAKHLNPHSDSEPLEKTFSMNILKAQYSNGKYRNFDNVIRNYFFAKNVENNDNIVASYEHFTKTRTTSIPPVTGNLMFNPHFSVGIPNTSGGGGMTTPQLSWETLSEFKHQFSANGAITISLPAAHVSVAYQFNATTAKNVLRDRFNGNGTIVDATAYMPMVTLSGTKPAIRYNGQLYVDQHIGGSFRPQVPMPLGIVGMDAEKWSDVSTFKQQEAFNFTGVTMFHINSFNVHFLAKPVRAGLESRIMEAFAAFGQWSSQINSYALVNVKGMESVTTTQGIPYIPGYEDYTALMRTNSGLTNATFSAEENVNGFRGHVRFRNEANIKSYLDGRNYWLIDRGDNLVRLAANIDGLRRDVPKDQIMNNLGNVAATNYVFKPTEFNRIDESDSHYYLSACDNHINKLIYPMNNASFHYQLKDSIHANGGTAVYQLNPAIRTGQSVLIREVETLSTMQKETIATLMEKGFVVGGIGTSGPNAYGDRPSNFVIYGNAHIFSKDRGVFIDGQGNVILRGVADYYPSTTPLRSTLPGFNGEFSDENNKTYSNLSPFDKNKKITKADKYRGGPQSFLMFVNGGPSFDKTKSVGDLIMRTNRNGMGELRMTLHSLYRVSSLSVNLDHIRYPADQMENFVRYTHKAQNLSSMSYNHPNMSSLSQWKYDLMPDGSIRIREHFVCNEVGIEMQEAHIRYDLLKLFTRRLPARMKGGAYILDQDLNLRAGSLYASHHCLNDLNVAMVNADHSRWGWFRLFFSLVSPLLFTGKPNYNDWTTEEKENFFDIVLANYTHTSMYQITAEFRRELAQYIVRYFSHVESPNGHFYMAMVFKGKVTTEFTNATRALVDKLERFSTKPGILLNVGNESKIKEALYGNLKDVRDHKIEDSYYHTGMNPPEIVGRLSSGYQEWLRISNFKTEIVDKGTPTLYFGTADGRLWLDDSSEYKTNRPGFTVAQRSLISPEGPLSKIQGQFLNYLSANNYTVIGGSNVTPRSTYITAAGHLRHYGDLNTSNELFRSWPIQLNKVPAPNRRAIPINRFTYGVTTTNVNGKNPWYPYLRDRESKSSLASDGKINPWHAYVSKDGLEAKKKEGKAVVAGITINYTHRKDVYEHSPFFTGPGTNLNNYHWSAGWNVYKAELYTHVSNQFLKENERGYESAGILVVENRQAITGAVGIFHYRWQVPAFYRNSGNPTYDMNTQSTIFNLGVESEVFTSYPFWTFEWRGVGRAMSDGYTTEHRFPTLVSHLPTAGSQHDMCYILDHFGKLTFINGGTVKRFKDWEHMDLRFNENAYLETYHEYILPLREVFLDGGTEKTPGADLNATMVIGGSGNQMLHFGKQYRANWKKYLTRNAATPTMNFIIVAGVEDKLELERNITTVTFKLNMKDSNKHYFRSTGISTSHADYGWISRQMESSHNLGTNSGLSDVGVPSINQLTGKPVIYPRIYETTRRRITKVATKNINHSSAHIVTYFQLVERYSRDSRKVSLPSGTWFLSDIDNQSDDFTWIGVHYHTGSSYNDGSSYARTKGNVNSCDFRRQSKFFTSFFPISFLPDISDGLENYINNKYHDMFTLVLQTKNSTHKKAILVNGS